VSDREPLQGGVGYIAVYKLILLAMLGMPSYTPYLSIWWDPYTAVNIKSSKNSKSRFNARNK
jgi:hypothetical protein